jgi:2-phosphoglycerate kinase
VHLVPGTEVLPPGSTATVVELLVAVHDPAEHQSHFYSRAQHTGDARPVERYLSAFEEIRRVQDHLLAAAARFDVPVVEAGHLDTAVRQIMDMVLERVAAAATLPPWPQPPLAASAPTSSS